MDTSHHSGVARPSTDETAAEMAVLSVVGDLRVRARRMLEAVARQTVADALQVVVADIASESAPALDPPEGLLVEVVRLPPATSWGAARAAALRRARAPIVAFIEDHCYPAPGWARALLEAHRQPFAAVGYAFTNPDTSSYLSRAAMVVDYGRWLHPARSGPSNLLAYNNVSYKRAALDDLEGPLEAWLATDFHVQRELGRRGHSMYVEARAVAAHENYDRLGDLLAANHSYSRALAADRARLAGWGRPRRLLHGLATPVVAPAISVLRLLRSLAGRPGVWRAVVGAAPVLLLSAVWTGIGESLGYLAGGRGIEERITHWEVNAQRSLGA